jgi:nitric oxide reductase subunit C
MLSKSQAKAFFILGTAVCGLAFVGLTLDTFKRIPKQTHEENLTPEVIRGKNLWDSNNCMGCHTLMGEGAYYAPELTKVYTRRGEIFIKSQLKDPEAMFPGGRKMTNFHFTDSEISDLTQFLKWIGEVDLNGFPPKPDLSSSPPSTSSSTVGATEVLSARNQPAIFSQVCIACHALHGKGGNVGPALDGVGSRRDAQYIGKWLHDPQSIKADSKMPKLPLSESEINELTSYLSQEKEGK